MNPIKLKEAQFITMYTQGITTEDQKFVFPSIRETAKKLEVSPTTCFTWVKKHNLKEKREHFQKQVLENVAKESAEYIATRWMKTAEQTIDVATKSMKRCNKLLADLDEHAKQYDEQNKRKLGSIAQESTALFKISSSIKNASTSILHISKEMHKTLLASKSDDYTVEEVVSFEYPDKVGYKVDIDGNVIEPNQIEDLKKDNEE